jgi:protein gp37
MHDIWNPWHGCKKKSEGCQHCYMYFLDKQRDKNGADIYKVKNNFSYPLQQDKNGKYKIKSGEHLRVCMTSDFFLEEADEWRKEAWNIIRQRPDVVFELITKRPERVLRNLPDDWHDGWENVLFNVTCENQNRANERIPIMLDLPFKHKGVFVAPFIGPVSLKDFLSSGQVEQVIAGGENYDGARPCHYEWVKALYDECVISDTLFCFIETGTMFVKDGKTYHLPNKKIQSLMAYKSGLQFAGREIHFDLKIEKGLFEDDNTYHKYFGSQCQMCGSRLICNGCSQCGQCKKPS